MLRSIYEFHTKLTAMIGKLTCIVLCFFFIIADTSKSNVSYNKNVGRHQRKFNYNGKYLQNALPNPITFGQSCEKPCTYCDCYPAPCGHQKLKRQMRHGYDGLFYTKREFVDNIVHCPGKTPQLKVVESRTIWIEEEPQRETRKDFMQDLFGGTSRETTKLVDSHPSWNEPKHYTGSRFMPDVTPEGPINPSLLHPHTNWNQPRLYTRGRFMQNLLGRTSMRPMKLNNVHRHPTWGRRHLGGTYTRGLPGEGSRPPTSDGCCET